MKKQNDLLESILKWGGIIIAGYFVLRAFGVI